MDFLLKNRLSGCLLAFGFSLFAPSTSMAQTYSSWENPDEPSSQAQAAESGVELQEFIDKLNAILDQAEKDKAASPLLLQDLRDLAQGVDNPWKKQVFLDDFKDNDYANNPNWTVASGRYWIEKGWGLRNGLDKAKSTSTTSSTQNNTAAAILLGNILNKALGGTTSKTGTPTTKSAYQPTVIYTPVKISNSFSLQLDLSSWVAEGQLTLGPYQGSNRQSGYLLTYTVGGSMELKVKSSNGTRLIDTAKGPFKLEDKKNHVLVWTRDLQGKMEISLDDKVIMNITDLSFRDGFQGFGMATRGGDFIVKQVSIHGAQ